VTTCSNPSYVQPYYNSYTTNYNTNCTQQQQQQQQQPNCSSTNSNSCCIGGSNLNRRDSFFGNLLKRNERSGRRRMSSRCCNNSKPAPQYNTHPPTYCPQVSSSLNQYQPPVQYLCRQIAGYPISSYQSYSNGQTMPTPTQTPTPTPTQTTPQYNYSYQYPSNYCNSDQFERVETTLAIPTVSSLPPPSTPSSSYLVDEPTSSSSVSPSPSRLKPKTPPILKKNKEHCTDCSVNKGRSITRLTTSSPKHPSSTKNSVTNQKTTKKRDSPVEIPIKRVVTPSNNSKKSKQVRITPPLTSKSTPTPTPPSTSSSSSKKTKNDNKSEIVGLTLTQIDILNSFGDESDNKKETSSLIIGSPVLTNSTKLSPSMFNKEINDNEKVKEDEMTLNDLLIRPSSPTPKKMAKSIISQTTSSTTTTTTTKNKKKTPNKQKASITPSIKSSTYKSRNSERPISTSTYRPSYQTQTQTQNSTKKFDSTVPKMNQSYYNNQQQTVPASTNSTSYNLAPNSNQQYQNYGAITDYNKVYNDFYQRNQQYYNSYYSTAYPYTNQQQQQQSYHNNNTKGCTSCANILHRRIFV
jgi:hypothetical protein